jgi:hypothetical protein
MIKDNDMDKETYTDVLDLIDGILMLSKGRYLKSDKIKVINTSYTRGTMSNCYSYRDLKIKIRTGNFIFRWKTILLYHAKIEVRYQFFKINFQYYNFLKYELSSLINGILLQEQWESDNDVAKTRADIISLISEKQETLKED